MITEMGTVMAALVQLHTNKRNVRAYVSEFLIVIHRNVTAQFPILDCTVCILDCTNWLDCTLRIMPGLAGVAAHWSLRRQPITAAQCLF